MSNVPHVESKNADLMARPLAVRMRPTMLDDVVGQDEALSNTSPLRAVATPPNMMSGSDTINQRRRLDAWEDA